MKTTQWTDWFCRGGFVKAGIATLAFPRLLVRSILAKNEGRYDWAGRKACLTLSFDCDYPQDIEALPDLLARLDKSGLKAGFACIGKWVEKYPSEHAAIVEGGHEILNHTLTHPDNELLSPDRAFRDLSREEKIQEIEKCHEVIQSVLGVEPIGFRAPHFKKNYSDDLYAILKTAGYRYSSSSWLTNTTSAGMPFTSSEGVVEFPLTTCPLHPYTAFDTWHSLNTSRLGHRLIHRGPERYIQLFKELLSWCIETGSYMNVYLDPLDIQKIPRFDALLQFIAEQDSLWVATYDELMGHFEKNGGTP